MTDTPTPSADDARSSNVTLRFLRGEAIADIAAAEGLDAADAEARVRLIFRECGHTYARHNDDLTAEVERMRAIIDHLRDGGFGEVAMVNVETREEPTRDADGAPVPDAPPFVLHRLTVSAPTLSEEILCDLLRPELDRIAAACGADIGSFGPVGTGAEPAKAAEASAKTKRRALALALRTVREALGVSIGAADDVYGIAPELLTARESGEVEVSKEALAWHLAALTGYANRLAAMQQDRDGALHQLKRANEQKVEADARYNELLHALLEQQGGSAIVFDLTPEARAAHVGRSIVETRLGGMGATKYVLAPREPATTTDGAA